MIYSLNFNKTQVVIQEGNKELWDPLNNQLETLPLWSLELDSMIKLTLVNSIID